MDFEQRLRQLNRIEPNQVYARSSRARILTVRPRLTLRAFLVGIVQSGSAIALTGLLLFLAVGGFSIWKLLGPLTGLDSASLRAEAEAIDIQIHLADLQYKDGISFDRQTLIAARPGLTAAAPASVGTGSGSGSDLPASTPAEAPSSTDGGSGIGIAANATSTASSTTVLTVDDVLELLSE